MAERAKIKVQIDAEKLCKHTLKITSNLKNFPKKYRFTLVDKVVRLTFDVHDNICDANNSFNKDERIYYIQRAISCCRKLDMYIRLVKEVLKPKCSISYWGDMVNSIVSQLENWKKYTKNKK